MGKYTVIADIGEKLVKLLQEHMVPEIVEDSGRIGLCTPNEKGDYYVGVCLYDIQESSEIRFSGMQERGIKEQKYPPVCLSLYYMVTAYSTADIKTRSSLESKMLGRVLQIFNDNNVIPASFAGQEMGSMDIKIELLNLPLEDKFKIWNGGSVPYKASLFYKVSPIELESEKTKEVQRVKEILFQIEE